MRKILLFWFALFLLCGCNIENSGTMNEKTAILPFTEQTEFVLTSGAGGWSTVLMLSPDGTFEGDYTDGELGDMEEDYPNGSVYLCPFTGNFRDIEKVDDFTYSMQLDTLSYEEKEEWIEDGVRYVPSYPYGIEGGETFYLYLPGKEVKDIPEGFLWWWFDYTHAHENQKPERLDCYGLYNEKTETGFVVWEE